MTTTMLTLTTTLMISMRSKLTTTRLSSTSRSTRLRSSRARRGPRLRSRTPSEQTLPRSTLGHLPPPQRPTARPTQDDGAMGSGAARGSRADDGDAGSPPACASPPRCRARPGAAIALATPTGESLFPPTRKQRRRPSPRALGSTVRTTTQTTRRKKTMRPPLRLENPVPRTPSRTCARSCPARGSGHPPLRLRHTPPPSPPPPPQKRRHPLVPARSRRTWLPPPAPRTWRARSKTRGDSMAGPPRRWSDAETAPGP